MPMFKSQPILLQPTDDTPFIFFQLIQPFGFDIPAFDFGDYPDHIPGLACAHIYIVIV